MRNKVSIIRWPCTPRLIEQLPYAVQAEDHCKYIFCLYTLNAYKYFPSLHFINSNSYIEYKYILGYRAGPCILGAPLVESECEMFFFIGIHSGH